MLYEIKEIYQPEMKAQICSDILRALPEWFANEEPIIDYVHKTQHMPFYAVFDKEKAVGFVAIKVHNADTAEVYVMGILGDYHRQGIGRQLIETCKEYCLANQKSFLTVKTLDASADYEPYERTRNFYSSVGFIPLEVFPLYWNIDNPCLFLVLSIH